MWNHHGRSVVLDPSCRLLMTLSILTVFSLSLICVDLLRHHTLILLNRNAVYRLPCEIRTGVKKFCYWSGGDLTRCKMSCHTRTNPTYGWTLSDTHMHRLISYEEETSAEVGVGTMSPQLCGSLSISCSHWIVQYISLLAKDKLLIWKIVRWVYAFAPAAVITSV